MREVLSAIQQWRAGGRKAALATVVKVYGSAPRPLGARMAVSSEREIAGSVSGGCVEGAVVSEALNVLESSRPKLIPFGISDERAWSVGLSCGGEIEVFVEPLPDENLLGRLGESLAQERSCVLCTGLQGGLAGKHLLAWPDESESVGDIAGADRDALTSVAFDCLESQRCSRVALPSEQGACDVLIEPFPPLPRLIVIGAVHAAESLIAYARILGFRTWVVDPRSAFASPERFGHADRLITDWPIGALKPEDFHESTYVAVLSHDDKLDNPALKMALESPCRYIGVLGSKKTQAKRRSALLGMGVSESALDRLHAPIGLNLGGRRPEEIALSIMAEIITVRYGVKLD